MKKPSAVVPYEKPKREDSPRSGERRADGFRGDEPRGDQRHRDERHRDERHRDERHRDERHRDKRRYRRPRLVEYGDVRDLTFGMTPGVGDSGNPAIFKPQGT